MELFNYSEDAGQHMIRGAKDHAQHLQNIVYSIQSGNLREAAEGIHQYSKAVKAGKTKADGLQDIFKLLSAFGKMGALLIVMETGVQILKQIVGGLFKINNMAGEFNRELTDNHGLVSQGMNVDIHVSGGDLAEQFRKYRQIYMETGFDTKTFLNKGDLMAVTKAYEEQGYSLETQTQDMDAFKRNLFDLVGYSLQNGMSLESTAQLTADWQRNMNLSLPLISGGIS